MTAPTYPPVLREPIAADAGGSFITNPMPESPTGSNAASIEGGFPPETMTSELAGGKPPLGQDMNGFLFLLSSHLVYLQSGLPYLFDADVAAALGGYPMGSVLGMADSSGLWINELPNNSVDPDISGGSGEEAGWRPMYSYGIAPIATTGGAVFVTSEQAKKAILVISGNITSNVTLNLPQVVQQWLIINATSGAFAVTANAGTGAPLNIPQGGFSSPLGVYTIGDGNLFPTVAPLGVPISQGPDPLTLAQRTNAGYLLATYFNQNSSSTENPTVGAVFVENTSADGFLRKISLAAFEAQLLLQNIAGTLVNGQVPFGVVQQWAAALFFNPAFTGTPTTPTAPIGTATNSVASTAFVNPGSGVNSNGSFRKNPDGSIDQWGSFAFTSNGGTIARTFPIAFPNAVESVVIGVPVAPSGLGGAGSYQADQSAAPTLGGFQYHSIASSNVAITVHWEAKGR